MQKQITDIFTKELIEKLRLNKDLITEDLLKELRKTNEGKEIALKILDLEKNDAGFYLDEFNRTIAFKKIPNLKPISTRLKLSEIHKIELLKCAKDIKYFFDNYVKIKTKSGVNFPELRGYQQEFLDTIINPEYESIVGLLPRQCISDSTLLKVNDENISIKDLFETLQTCKILQNCTNSLLSKTLQTCNTLPNIANLQNCDKFIDSVYPKNKFIETDIGKIQIKAIHKTIPLKMVIIKTQDFELKCAENHSIIDKNNNEIFAINSLNKEIKTKNGIQKVISLKKLKKLENCYDLELYNHHLYFSNGILSHNSGKSVTCGAYIAWLIVFEKACNIGIAGNRFSLAKEFLDKVKDIFAEIPVWMTPGCKYWNMNSVAFENNVRVLADTATSNSFRGHTVKYLVVDEAAYITGTENGTSKFEAFLDAILPSQSSLAKKKNIFISTANGVNSFYDLFQGAKSFDLVEEVLDKNKIIYSDTIENHFKSKDYPEEIIDIQPINSQNNGDMVQNSAETLPNSTENSQTCKTFAKYKVKYKKRKIGKNGSISFYTDWRKVPRYNSDGSVKDPEKFKEEIVKSKGILFFEQAYACSFIGSSQTLINSEVLKSLKPNEIIDRLGTLKVYESPETTKRYVCSVDTAKGGGDGFCIQFLDITDLNKIKQVAVSNTNSNYLEMASKLYKYCEFYNFPYLIIENNEGSGQSIADQMKLKYNYPNLHYDKGKKYPGTRTTKITRDLMLKTLKYNLETERLILNDKETINQFFTFILLKGKYQADDGAKDDLIMSLALSFIKYNEFKDISIQLKPEEKKKVEIKLPTIKRPIFGIDPEEFETPEIDDGMYSFY